MDLALTLQVVAILISTTVLVLKVHDRHASRESYDLLVRLVNGSGQEPLTRESLPAAVRIHSFVKIKKATDGDHWIELQDSKYRE